MMTLWKEAHLMRAELLEMEERETERKAHLEREKETHLDNMNRATPFGMLTQWKETHLTRTEHTVVCMHCRWGHTL